jgi:hypothetical protein
MEDNITDFQENNMPKSKLSINKNASNYGAIAGLIISISYLIIYFMNKFIEYLNFMSWFSYLIIIISIVLGILNYRNKVLNGYINYGKALGAGVLIGLYASIIVGFAFYIIYKSDASLIDKLLEKAQEMLETNPKYSEDIIDKQMEIARKFTTPFILFLSSIFNMTFMSFIFSLIIAAFLKKKDTSFDSNFKDIQ